MQTEDIKNLDYKIKNHPIKDYFYAPDSLKTGQNFQKGDLFVVFGELFNRGYANGLVEFAKQNGLTIIGTTMGRHKKGVINALNEEELTKAKELLGGDIINIPLEAGFDLEPTKKGTVVDMLSDLKLDNWKDFNPDLELVKEALDSGKKRFNKALKQVMAVIEEKYDGQRNIFFAHTMAGGIIRAKILLILANRVFKGVKERYIASADLANSNLGKLVGLSFNEVTANTFKYLIDASFDIRKKAAQNGKEVFYSAYGYHGCHIYVKDEYRWQTYTPYQQGHAKKRLESYAVEYRKQGIKATVFNCPEIRTNSSDIFLGVELSLIPFLKSLKLNADKHIADKIWQECQAKLKEGNNLEELLVELYKYFDDEAFKSYSDIEKWPLENTPALAQIMVGTSEKWTNLHLDRKNLITDYLSSIIIKATGKVIFQSALNEQKPVIWLGHKLLAKHAKP